jgi:hypothetical protein
MSSVVVPELSRFFGIVIRMFVEVGGPHHRPHFHAYYQDQAAVFAVNSIRLNASAAVCQRRSSGNPCLIPSIGSRGSTSSVRTS